jgi:opacity protein-like surface antigen
MKKMNKIGLISVAAAVAAVFMAQPASAHPHKKVVKHARVAKKSVAGAGMTIQSSMESRLRQMEAELSQLRSELGKTRTEHKATTEKMAEHSQKVEEKLTAIEEHEESHHSLLFFRGGYAKMSHARDGELLVNNNLLNAASLNEDVRKDGEGWYVGAGFDHRLTDNLWGISEMAAVDGEVMFEYKNFGSNTNALVNFLGSNVIADAPGAIHIKNQITQFTLTASPKIKFNTGTPFTPWIIPVGLGIHVISPPSSGVTVLNPGLMVGAGAEYKLWQSLHVGLDFRYHFTGDDLDYKAKVPGLGTVLNKVNTDGLTAGAYLGFGF